MESVGVSVALSRMMEHECDLLVGFREEELAMRSAVGEQDWSALELAMKRMIATSVRVGEAENRRRQHFDQLRAMVGEPDNSSFYQVAIHFPAAEREALTAQFRKLKYVVLSIQALTASIGQQVGLVNQTMGRILDELLPHRKGNLYSGRGTRREVGPDPLVLNRRL